MKDNATNRAAAAPTNQRRKLLVIPFAALVALLAFVVYAADRMLGIAAFTRYYLLFCGMASLLLGAIWLAMFRKGALPAGLAVFGLLAANLLLPPPAERLLRAAMLEIPVGTRSDAIETIVEQVFKGSRYPLPHISKDRVQQFDRVHVSLLSLRNGNCTALLFLIEDGKVVRGIFSPD